MRFRVATPFDVKFVQNWNEYRILNATTLRGPGMMENEDQPAAQLETETDESKIEGASLMSAISSSLITSPRSMVRVKTHADPQCPNETEYMKPQ